MQLLGDVDINWDAPCREAEFIRWEKNTHRNFKANKITDHESQAGILWYL